MLTGIALTLAVLAFAGFFYVYNILQTVTRNNRMLFKKVKAQKSLINEYSQKLTALSTFDKRLEQLHTLSEQNASRLTALQIGKR